MHCPFCNQEETKVIDSRLVAEGGQVRRRRECLACNERFTTYETAELMLPRIIKRDGRREAFSEDNIRKGMSRALEKRSVSVELIEQAIDKIKQCARAAGERELPAQQIGAWVMEELQALDDVAYVRFASVYRRFKDVSDFKETIEHLATNHKRQNANHE